MKKKDAKKGEHETETRYFEIDVDELRQLLAEGKIKIREPAQRDLQNQQGSIVIEVAKDVVSGVIVSVLSSKAALVAAGILVAPFAIAGGVFLAAKSISEYAPPGDDGNALDSYEQFMP